MKRQSISKRNRFEVFKRDGFCCQYCGSTPPAVVLEIDHIQPVSKGGDNDIDNLVTACFDCNRGKTNNLLSELPETVKEKAELLREKEEQLAEFNKLLRKKKARQTREINKIEKVFSDYFENKCFTQSFKDSVRNNFLPYIHVSDLERAMGIACNKCEEPESAVKYFCGICWKWKKEGIT